MMTRTNLARNTVLYSGDCLQVMQKLTPESFDAVVTDPPYHLTSTVKRFGKEGSAPAQFGTDGAFARASKGFMGKAWDGGDIAFRSETWRLCYDLLKPGGHMAVFGGSRTYHRIACAIEDAGFEIRDSLMWLYGTGFPKSHDVAKGIDKAAGAAGGAAWQGWGTALKPAFEPIILARKPLIGTVAANTLAHGVGGINIDACRIEGGVAEMTGRSGASTPSEVLKGNIGIDTTWEPSRLGRWPANVMHDGSDEVLAAFAAYGERSTSKPGKVFKRVSGADANGNTGSALGAESRAAGSEMVAYGDTGTAARFFYSAKASAGDRAGSKHPTVKPLALMSWLVKLITPPSGKLLDPFAGSGSTLQAALNNKFKSVGIELDAEYQQDILRRFKK